VPDRRLGYVIASWQPYRDYRSTVDLEATSDGGTRIVWQSTFEVLVPGTGALLRFLLSQVVAGFARRLARAADAAG
jgi:hypothetical protein